FLALGCMPTRFLDNDPLGEYLLFRFHCKTPGQFRMNTLLMGLFLVGAVVGLPIAFRHIHGPRQNIRRPLAMNVTSQLPIKPLVPIHPQHSSMVSLSVGL